MDEFVENGIVPDWIGGIQWRRSKEKKKRDGERMDGGGYWVVIGITGLLVVVVVLVTVVFVGRDKDFDENHLESVFRNL